MLDAWYMDDVCSKYIKINIYIYKKYLYLRIVLHSWYLIDMGSRSYGHESDLVLTSF